MIKVGQIGIGHNHAEGKMLAIRKFPELFEVVGFAEKNEEWIKKRGSLPCYQGLSRLSEEEIIEKSDALIIETDVWNLTKTAQKCINAGKHIHMDKPASGTLEEFKYLLDTAEKNNLVIQMGYMYRYNPSILKIFDMVKNGELGTIHSINAEMSTYHSDNYRMWLNNFLGGNMYIFGSHLIDLIIFLMGKPKSIQASITSSKLNNVISPDVSSAILTYDNALARVFISSVECNGWGRRCFSIAGSDGTVELRPIETPVKLTFAKKGEGKDYLEDYAKEIKTGDVVSAERYDKMVRDFYSFVKGKRKNVFTYDHEYAVQEVLNEIIGGLN